MSVDTISNDELLRRAVRGAKNMNAGRAPRWAVISELFGLGSTYSAQLCRRYGVDPDEQMARGKLDRPS